MGSNATPVLGKLTLKQKMIKFFKKYFCEGQKLEKSQEVALQTLDPNASFTERLLVQNRQLIGVLIPFTLYNVIWLELLRPLFQTTGQNLGGT